MAAAVIDGTAERPSPAMTRIAAGPRTRKRPTPSSVVRPYQPGWLRSPRLDVLRVRPQIEAGARTRRCPTPHAAHRSRPTLADRRPARGFDRRLHSLSGRMQPVGTNEVILQAALVCFLPHLVGCASRKTSASAPWSWPVWQPAQLPARHPVRRLERDYRAVLITDATSQTNSQRLDDLASIGGSICSTPSQSLPRRELHRLEFAGGVRRRRVHTVPSGRDHPDPASSTPSWVPSSSGLPRPSTC